MNKIISLMVFVFLFCGVKTFSQIYVPVNPTVYGVNELRHKAFLAQHIPEKTSLLTNTNDTTAQIFINKADSNVWAYYKPRGFFKIGSGGGGFALDSIYVFDLIDTNMTLHPGHVSIFVSHLILDSLKHKYIDTGARMRNGYVLSFDSTNKKWVMVPNAGGGGGGGGTLQNAADASILASDNPTINFHQNSFSMDSTSFSQSSYGGSTKGLINNVGGSVTLSVEDPSDLVRGTSISMNLNTIIVNPRTYGTVGFVQLVNTVNSEADSLDVVAIDTTNGYLYRKRISGGTSVHTIYNSDDTITSTRVVELNGNDLNFENASSELRLNINTGDGAVYMFTPLGKELAISDDTGGFIASLEGGNNIVLNSSGLIISAATNSFIGSTWDWNDGGSNHYLHVSNTGVNIEGQYILPNNTGSTNQFMQTDGSGTANWADMDTTNISNFSTKVRSLFSVSSPLTYNNATGAFAITAMDATHAGYVAAGVASKKRLGGDGNWYDTTASSTGTVTSIATGYGLSGGTITTTGTIIADSTLLLTKLRATSLYQPIGTYVTSVSGTSNRITSTGGTTPVIDISASYVGQSSITTLGTVTTGTLSTGAVIRGVTMTLGSDAQGDIYYRNGSGILTRLAAGTSSQKLTGGTTPSWKDSTAASTGTVTSVATGLGLSGGTITTTGTLLVDTSSASILSRQRAANTYWGLAGNTGVNLPDTSTRWLGTTNNTPLRFKTNGTGRMIIDSIGNVGIGTSSPSTLLNIVSQSSTTSNVAFFDYYASDAVGVSSLWRKARGTLASPSGVNSGDALGFFSFRGYRTGNGFSGSSSAYIQAVASENFSGANNFGGDLQFGTSTNASGTNAVRMIISNNGGIAIGNFTPTAKLHLPAGTTTANTAPLKFTLASSALTSVAEIGAFEPVSNRINYTDSTGVRYILHAGGTPTIAAGVGAGSSPTISITGIDEDGYISVTTGTLPTLSGTVATVTFSSAYGVTPKCVLISPANSNASLLTGVTMVFVDQAGISTTSWAITAGTSALTAATSYKFYYRVMQ